MSKTAAMQQAKTSSGSRRVAVDSTGQVLALTLGCLLQPARLTATELYVTGRDQMGWLTRPARKSSIPAHWMD